MSNYNELQVNEQRNRNIAGAQSNKALEFMLDELVREKNFNITVIKGYAEGYPNMEKQFKMDYCVIFHDFDDKQWLLKITSTIRDRITGTEFFAQNIRIIDSDAGRVERIYVVVPDSLSVDERANAKRYSRKISSPKYKSFLSDVVTINELRELIISKCMSQISQGIRSNIIGMDAEKRVAMLLNDEKNWRLWNNYELYKHEVKSDTFQWFKVILSGIGAKPSFGYTESTDQIEKITATDDIPKLKGGGYPKTDVSFTITTQFRKEETFNITIKKTSEKQVSVHEGNISDLADALKLDYDSQLRGALIAFQKYGSMKGLHDSQDSIHLSALYSLLPKYNRELVEFAFFGVGSPRITDKIQIANCILYFSGEPEKNSFLLRDDFVEHYMKTFVEKGQFGTPFQWTYPSKKRGQSFQLKGFTNS